MYVDDSALTWYICVGKVIELALMAAVSFLFFSGFLNPLKNKKI